MPQAVLERTVELHQVQQDFCQSKALYRAFIGGRGAGKTWVGAYDLLRRAWSTGPSTYLVASPTGVLMWDTTFPTFRSIARHLGLWDSVRLSPWPNVTLTTGATIRFRTAEDPEKMRGPNLSGAWLDEGSLMEKDAYLITIAALREAGKQGWLTVTATPKGMLHWTYEVFGTAQPDTEYFHAPTHLNPFNPPEFAETLRRQYGEGGFARQELGGEWVDEEDLMQCIPTAWVRLAQARWTPEPPAGQGLTCIGADVARGGADSTAPASRYGPWIGKVPKYQGVCTDDGPKAARLILKDHDGKAPVYIDGCGLGVSAYDFAKLQIGSLAVCVNVAAASERFDKSGKYKLTNVRAMIWWTMREALNPASGQDIALPPGNEVLADLTAPRFEVIASGIKVEAKEKIKERIGRSPDVGDAIALTFRPPKAAAFIV